MYWDHSNLFLGAQSLCRKIETQDAQYRVRLDVDHLLQLATKGRRIGNAVVAGSVPPDVEKMWCLMRKNGVRVSLYKRGIDGEQQHPDIVLQLAMLQDCLDNPPATVVLMTGDGVGWKNNEGFYSNLKRMYEKGWQVELMSWMESCSTEMMSWVRENGVFIPLDTHYFSVTYLEPSKEGWPPAPPRHSTPLNMSLRGVLAEPTPRPTQEATPRPTQEDAAQED